MRALVLIALFGAAPACGGLRQAARFEGDPRAGATRPESVRESVDLPAGHDRLGRVTARCTALPEGAALEGVWASDAGCSEALLTRALVERAARVGGEVLVGRACESRASKRAGAADVVCEADVARRSAHAPPTLLATGAAVAYPLDEPPAYESWRVRLEVSRRGRVQRAARRVELVGELAVMPVTHVVLGEVVARCEAGCSERGARHALRIAAARLGASDAVGIRCVGQGSGWECVGTAAGPEVEEPEVAVAR
ncbi:MAG: hypothetical protein IT376_01545 [Polyangiaceae bacterium]|nr:hypothetical protein [Polyangiaceae bacterium]